MKRIILAALISACSPSQQDVITEQLAVDTRCEQLLPGECFGGRWTDANGLCTCKFNPEECRASCSANPCYHMVAWSHNSCTCDRNYEACP